ncbi:uncharacterized protein LOC144553755 [Carex rostrata]
MYQGFIESKGNKTPEKIGFEYVQQLCQRSLFEREGMYERNDLVCRKFKLHDIVHDLARCNSEDGCLSITSSKLPIFPNVLHHLYIAEYVMLRDPIPSDKVATLRTLIITIENFSDAFDFSMAPKLRALVMQSDDYGLGQSLSSMKHLRYLSLGNVETLPECICSLYSLRNLSLKECSLKVLPRKIGNLISLEELIINECKKLEVLPESLCQLKALRKLSICSCYKIKELPNNIGNVVSLEELRIDSCSGLRVLPESLCQLKALRKLSIGECGKIKELPNNIGNLISLEKLIINMCDKLEVLPESLCQLKALRKLSIGECGKIKELPNNIGNLISLEKLIINMCDKLEVLPESLCQLKALRKLSIVECGKIKELPNNIGKLYLSGLVNISNLMDVQCANLMSMHNLEHLALNWNEDEDDNYGIPELIGTRLHNIFHLKIKRGENIFLGEQSCFSVMASLQPHPNLTKLEIDGYNGITFPEWIGSLYKLKYLKITSCDSLQFLKEESLPLELEQLEICECYQLVSMPGIQNLKSLVKLFIRACENLCSFMEPSLELTMRAGVGSYGTSLLGLTNLPSLRSLKISDCEKLQVLVHELLPAEPCEVEVCDCPGLKEWCLQHKIFYKHFHINSTRENRVCNCRTMMGLRGVINNLLTKLLPSVIASAQAPSSSNCPPADQNHQVEAELKKLQGMLERIKATLYDAEQREIRDKSVKLWLKELNGVAYDAEDVLGEYHYEVLQAEVEARDASSQDSRKRKLIQVPYGMLGQIQQIRSRFDEIMEHRIALQLSEGDGPMRCNNELQIAPVGPFVVESNIFGRESEKEKLIEVLSSERNVVSVVTIVGMGGIGKTTLAQLAYNDQRIQQQFDKFGWICVSEDFNVERLTKESLESITGNACSITNLGALQENLLRVISGERVLLVLDDVWNEKKSFWDSFQTPFMSAKFAKILVTTRNDPVALIMQTEPTLKIRCLSTEQCWQLFEHYAFGGVDQNKSRKLVGIGKQIIKKCGMLPLAVKSIASLLRHEAEEESWREILESELWETDASNEIFPPLQISYARLPTYLKSCFLYCSVFPKDHVYDVEALVKLWMYQGFIESKGNKTPKKIGFEYAQQMCQRSLFEREVSMFERNDLVCRKFKLHDIVHDLARRNSENGCLSITFSKLPIFPNVLHHLYIAKYVILEDPIPSDKVTTLRTLILHSKNISDTFDFSMVPKLRVLQMDSHCYGIRQSLSSIGNLKHLRYLSLGNVETLPECICSLYSLQNLSLEECSLIVLPRKIGNLISLEELIINECKKLEVLPESLCQLKALRKLSIGECGEIKELPNNIGNLISLEELIINKCDKLEVLPESLCQLKALRKLSICSCDKIKELPNNIGNVVSLEELRIECCSGLRVLPCSLCQLKALRKLCLMECVLLEEFPIDMGSLTDLKTLKIWDTGVSCLPSLSKFVEIQELEVGIECKTIGWLKNFHDLGRKLCLTGLKNISNLMDVRCANLMSMHNLKHLALNWNEDSLGEIFDVPELIGTRLHSIFHLKIKRGENIFLEEQSCFSVMASLQPHPYQARNRRLQWHSISRMDRQPMQAKVFDNYLLL